MEYFRQHLQLSDASREAGVIKFLSRALKSLKTLSGLEENGIYCSWTPLLSTYWYGNSSRILIGRDDTYKVRQLRIDLRYEYRVF